MKSTNKTEKTNKDIKNNSLFTEMTAQEEAFVSGGRSPRIVKIK